MLPTRSKLWFFLLFVAVSACANQVQDKEDMLAAAGFTLVPANTPQRQAALKTLPPHKFVHQVRNNVVVFTYADPTICDCLYVGDQAAYDRYRQNVFVKNIADEQQMTAQMNQMDWGPWGPGWYCSVTPVPGRQILSVARGQRRRGCQYQRESRGCRAWPLPAMTRLKCATSGG